MRPSGQVVVRKGQKLPLPLKITPKCSIFALAYIFLREIRRCHTFLTKHYIRLLWDSSRSNGVKRCLHVYVCITTPFRIKLRDTSTLLYPVSLVLNKMFTLHYIYVGSFIQNLKSRLKRGCF